MSFTQEGLVIPRLPEIEDQIEASQVANIERRFRYNSNKLISQLNSVYAAQADRLAELIEAAFDSTKISRAEGFHLDELGLLRGVYRNDAIASSTSSQFVWMRNGSVLPSGSSFASSVLEGEVVNTAEVVANAASCAAARIVVSTVLSNRRYSVIINGTTYTFVSLPDSTAESILTQLSAEINADLVKTFTFSFGDDVLEVVADENTSLSARVPITGLQVRDVKTFLFAQSVTTGPEEFPAETVDILNSSVPGFIETNNQEEYFVGTGVETDESFRSRIQAGVTQSSTGTLPSILSALQTNVTGVSLVSVAENTNDFPTDSAGRPIHSYEVLIIGGDDNDIAAEVWRTKPIGIQLFGNTLVNFTDSSGEVREISFSRPSRVSLAARVQYQTYTEEALPANVEQTIADSVDSYLNSLTIGVDAIPGRVFGDIYSNTTGIGQMIIEFQVIANVGDTPNAFAWAADVVEISSSDFASIDAGDITVQQI